MENGLVFRVFFIELLDSLLGSLQDLPILWEVLLGSIGEIPQ